MSHALITGFTPFDGRPKNASWIAARGLVAQHRTAHVLHALCIPVCWGQPLLTVLPALDKWRPRCVIAMGEGGLGCFRIEVVARNLRKPRLDNAGALPPTPCVDPLGPATRTGTAPCELLQLALCDAGFPTALSNDAGAYLCEELLYTLLGLQELRADLQTVLFVHLPPYGSALQIRDKTRVCDETLLMEFTQSLFASCTTLNLL